MYYPDFGYDNIQGPVHDPGYVPQYVPEDVGYEPPQYLYQYSAWPNISIPKLPDPPKVDLPKFPTLDGAPHISFPAFSSKLEMPKFELPKFTPPSLQNAFAGILSGPQQVFQEGMQTMQLMILAPMIIIGIGVIALFSFFIVKAVKNTGKGD